MLAIYDRLHFHFDVEGLKKECKNVGRNPSFSPVRPVMCLVIPENIFSSVRDRTLRIQYVHVF